MKDFINLLVAALVLVGIFLFLNHGDKTVRIIQTAGGVMNDSFRTLQGRG